MKKLFVTSMIVLYSVFANAEIPQKIKVYVPWLSIMPLCTSLVEEYNKIYNSSAVIVYKPGAGGLLALQEVIQEKDFSIVCGTGTTDAVLYKVNVPETFHNVYQQIQTINIINFTGIYYFTGKDNRHSTLKSLLNSSTVNKPITVGFEGLGSKTITGKIIGKTPVTWVQYKSAADAASSLVTNDLDLFIGGFSQLLGLVENNKLKILGHINVDTAAANAIGPNLAADYPDAFGLANFLSISSLSKYTKEDLEEMNKRISVILSIKEIRENFAKANYIIINQMSIEKINQHLLKYNSLLVQK